MKNLKLYSILILLLSLLLSTSCVNNDDKGSGGNGGGGDGEVPLTPENLEKGEGEWEIAYMTQRIKTIANGGPDITFRMYGMDGFIKEFYDDSLYMEHNSNKEETIYEGKYSLYPKQDSIILKYSFLNPDTELVEDSTSRIKVFKLNDKMLVYHISYFKRPGVNDDAYFRQLVFYLRNKKNAPNEFLVPNDILKNNEKKGRIDPKSLHGAWEIVDVKVQSKSNNSTSWDISPDDENELEIERANIGQVYSYDTSGEEYKFVETKVSGKSKEGVFTVSDDVMHYYYETTDDKGKKKKVMDSMAIEMGKDGKSFMYVYNKYNLTATSFYVRRYAIYFKKVQ